MNHGVKRLICLLIMGLSLAFVVRAALYQQYLLIMLAIFFMIICIRMLLGQEQKLQRYVKKMIAENQTFDAVIDSWVRKSGETKGRHFLVLLSFTIAGHSYQRGYEAVWERGSPTLDEFIKQHPLGSKLKILYSPEYLEILVIEESQQILNEVSVYTFDCFFKQKQATQ